MRAAVAAALIAFSALLAGPWVIQTVAAFGVLGALVLLTGRLLDRYPRKYLYIGGYIAALIVAFPFTVLATIVALTVFMLYFLMGVTFADSRWVVDEPA